MRYLLAFHWWRRYSTLMQWRVTLAHISLCIAGTLLADELPASFLLVEERYLLASYWWRRYLMAVASLFSLLSATSSVRRIRLDSAPTSASAVAVPYLWMRYLLASYWWR
jgi:hypothetical protein